MKNETVEIKVKGVIPSTSGCALFVGNDAKIFVIYVEPMVGQAITEVLSHHESERPMTHELMLNVLKGFNISLDRVVINDVDDGTFFARMILSMKNELGTKLVEIDARPSDCMILALAQKKPILVAKKVFNEVQDLTDVFTRLWNQNKE